MVAANELFGPVRHIIMPGGAFAAPCDQLIKSPAGGIAGPDLWDMGQPGIFLVGFGAGLLAFFNEGHESKCWLRISQLSMIQSVHPGHLEIARCQLGTASMMERFDMTCTSSATSRKEKTVVVQAVCNLGACTTTVFSQQPWVSCPSSLFVWPLKRPTPQEAMHTNLGHALLKSDPQMRRICAARNMAGQSMLCS